MSDSELSSKYVLQTAGFDARFPNTNQTRHCFQNYTDYFKCIAAKGEDFAPCKQFKRAYNSLCPSEHIDSQIRRSAREWNISRLLGAL
ncbi:hypothetical protein PAXRUDRAFT_833206, partial [Paxillus rubicundulus Ve08.2h10]